MIVSVLVEVSIGVKEKTFDYNVPIEFYSLIKKGIRVKVPFGPRILEGFVLEIKENTEYQSDLKNIIDVIDKKPLLNEELLLLGKKLSHDNVCNLINVYQSMLPVGLKAKNSVNIKEKTEAYIYLINEKSAKEFLKISKAKKQNEIIEKLLEDKEILKNNYKSYLIKPLVEKKLIDIKYKRVVTKEETKMKPFKSLNSEQKRCVDEINKSNKNIILLNGVTGSGKTEIYINLINTAIKNNKEAIMLVPEISLTPQIVERFKVHFKNKIAIFHSGLSNREKYDEYKKIMNKEVSIVIGARSAIFVPFTNIGLIVIDEEHSNTYKQDHNPRYNAIDVAFLRAKYHNAKVILGSATPSIESYARSKKGYYDLVKLDKRANDACMPIVNIINMKDEIKKGNTIFSKELLLSIEDRLNKKEQIMLLINRRGYSSYLVCQNCGEVLKCPNCDITLTYHKTSNMNRCHYCGYADLKRDMCNNCFSKELKSYGIGTEKVEEEISILFSNARVLRMDIDTTSKKGSHKDIIDKFNNHEADILVGTQMIAKGLDFPLVTLVGVINADTVLNLPDFRSSEKTYQLISQVSGRAGRDKLPGKVIIQTFNPNHYSIELAKNHNFDKFYEREIKIRKKLGYPPYFFITNLMIKGKDFSLTLNEGKKISDFIRKNSNKKIIVLGPSVGSVSKINNIYKFNIILKFRDKEYVINLLNELVKNYHNNKTKLEIDMNPLNL